MNRLTTKLWTLMVVAAFVAFSFGSAAGQPPQGKGGSKPAMAKGPKVLNDSVAILGLRAGPVMWEGGNNTGFLLTVNGAQYMIDCGAGTPQAIFDLGLGFTPLKNLFFTHYHFDHTVGYFDLMARAYQTRPHTLKSLDVWGPPGLKKITDGLMTAHDIGFNLHNWNPKRPNLPPTPTVHEFDLPKTGNQKVYEDANVIVTATRVYHDKDVPNAYGYRFDIKSGPSAGKSVVFSGDTVKNDQLIALAKDATMLVHEVGINALAEKISPKGSALYKHLINSHTDVAEIPVIAKEANVGMVVLQHYGNVKLSVAESAKLIHSKVMAANASVGYQGKIIAPVELDVIDIE
jgi:ribonuclease BN (tRNA processing enzyme)